MTDRPPFVETHVHFHDFKHPTMKWAWLEWGWIHPILGDIGALQSQRYLAEEFLHETRFQNVAKVIHVQAALGSPDPVDETAWLQEAFERTGIPNGIVAECPLADDDAEAILDRQAAASPNLRGIRNFGQGDYLTDPAWKRGYARLAKYDLVCCLDSSPEVYAKAKALAQEVPDVTLCLDHTGFPRERTDAYFANWKKELAEPRRGRERRDQDQRASACATRTGRSTRSARGSRRRSRPSAPSARSSAPTGRSTACTPRTATCSTPTGRSSADYSPDEKTALWSGNAERIFRI